MTMACPLSEGWLFKEASLGPVTTRLPRYCILTEKELRYYKHKSDSRPNGILELKQYLIAEKDSGKHHSYGFRIVSQCKQHRSYTFYADNEKECQYWVDMINNVCQKGFFDTSDDAVLAAMDEPCSVLDKWLNRLDLNDEPTRTPPSSLPPLVHSPATSATTTINTSPQPSSNRMSSDSLDTLPSETTLSSSAGSRAYMSMNPTSSPDQQLVSKSSFNKRHSNPINFVSRSLSNLKNHHGYKPTHPPHHHSPNWSFDSISQIKPPVSLPRKGWETEDLFHFEHHRDTYPPSLSH